MSRTLLAGLLLIGLTACGGAPPAKPAETKTPVASSHPAAPKAKPNAKSKAKSKGKAKTPPKPSTKPAKHKAAPKKAPAPADTTTLINR